MAPAVVSVSALAPSAHAAILRACGTNQSDLACKLQSVLNALYVVAAILSAFLIAAVLFAVRVYRRYRSGRELP